MIPALGLVIGVLVGVLLQPEVPLWLQPYLPIAVIAALDAVFGAVRAVLDGIFNDKVFVVSFLSNVVVAAFIVFLGDQARCRQPGSPRVSSSFSASGSSPTWPRSVAISSTPEPVVVSPKKKKSKASRRPGGTSAWQGGPARPGPTPAGTETEAPETEAPETGVPVETEGVAPSRVPAETEAVAPSRVPAEVQDAGAEFDQPTRVDPPVEVEEPAESEAPEQRAQGTPGPAVACGARFRGSAGTRARARVADLCPGDVRSPRGGGGAGRRDRSGDPPRPRTRGDRRG